MGRILSILINAALLIEVVLAPNLVAGDILKLFDLTCVGFTCKCYLVLFFTDRVLKKKEQQNNLIAISCVSIHSCFSKSFSSFFSYI